MKVKSNIVLSIKVRLAIGMTLILLSLPLLIVITDTSNDILRDSNFMVDSDGDGIDDNADSCELGNWQSNNISDYDSDGCLDEMWISGEMNENYLSSSMYSIHEIDSAGNEYFSGLYAGTMNLENYSITSVGNIDIFVAKRDISGNWEWLVSAGGTGTDYVEEIEIDSNGYVYLAGLFSASMSFGNHSVDPLYSGYDDIYLAKLDNSGNWEWALKEEEQIKNLLII